MFALSDFLTKVSLIYAPTYASAVNIHLFLCSGLRGLLSLMWSIDTKS